MYSGTVGYCPHLGQPTSIQITWNDNRTVIDVSCDYRTCGQSEICKLYQQNPVGFHKTFPKKK